MMMMAMMMNQTLVVPDSWLKVFVYELGHVDVRKQATGRENRMMIMMLVGRVDVHVNVLVSMFEGIPGRIEKEIAVG